MAIKMRQEPREPRKKEDFESVAKRLGRDLDQERFKEMRQTKSCGGRFEDVLVQ